MQLLVAKMQPGQNAARYIPVTLLSQYNVFSGVKHNFLKINPITKTSQFWRYPSSQVLSGLKFAKVMVLHSLYLKSYWSMHLIVWRSHFFLFFSIFSWATICKERILHVKDCSSCRSSSQSGLGIQDAVIWPKQILQFCRFKYI